MNLSDARQLDHSDPLKDWRKEFHFPASEGVEEIYFLGNSLGLMPRRAERAVTEELDKWKAVAGRGHFEGRFPWLSFHEPLAPLMADLVGAESKEVVMMNSLTVNLHLMMASFYRPTQRRYKILIEDHAFPSDQYAVESQARWHHYDPASAIIRLQPDQGQLFSTESICQTIEDHADSLAMILLPGVQYYTGQVFDMEAIAAKARQHQIPIGLDLAHAVGNIELKLHQWQIDFAVWCSYKYLNSGPGAIAGCFVHQQHFQDSELPRLAGWWGHDKSSRFLMPDQFIPIPTAEAWQLSNPPIFSLAAVRGSLEVFQAAGGMGPLRQKSKKLSQFFRQRLTQTLGDQVSVISPPEMSGCQLSLQFLNFSQHHSNPGERPGKEIYRALEAGGIRVDWREPNVIRAAPTPLYNTFAEVDQFVDRLAELLD
jgi:kynureninase